MELGEDGSVYKSILVRDPGAGQVGRTWLYQTSVPGLGSQDSIVASVGHCSSQFSCREASLLYRAPCGLAYGALATTIWGFLFILKHWTQVTSFWLGWKDRKQATVVYSLLFWSLFQGDKPGQGSQCH